MKARDYLALMDKRWLQDDAGSRHEEYEDLLALLLDAAKASGALGRDPDVVPLAQAVARACMGEDHLWHDLGLPSRLELSALLMEHFPTLAQANTGNMRWKKFFYLKLCERAEIRACRAPSCSSCIMQTECFGEEVLPLAYLQPRNSPKDPAVTALGHLNRHVRQGLGDTLARSGGRRAPE